MVSNEAAPLGFQGCGGGGVGTSPHLQWRLEERPGSRVKARP